MDAKLAARNEAEELCNLVEEQLTFGPPDKCVPAIEDLPPEISAVISRPGGCPPKGAQHNETFIKARKCLQTCAEIARQYQEFNRRPTGIKKPNLESWNQDVKDLRALNHRAMTMSIQALNGIVMARAQRDAGRTRDEIDAIASELLEGAIPKDIEDTWGTMARKVVKLLGSAAELLPMEVE
ncbi:hypothetical protein JDV02_006315 [Purpureocillium takamizusanense]|uniref:Uncharacterized protein n=1 Tax=Purpureocillium takamizusanense TaxID=2060973 RepID=A0A9Q8QK04_9HYPO|nr:uncharacterized protein JDV02_006315 [Purpureocillium takamizusanense]UNI20204.1 hypothetical protein JDV02_006315 [Purpureocillium takamizusanense]